jgi:outer membrane protein
MKQALALCFVMLMALSASATGLSESNAIVQPTDTSTTASASPGGPWTGVVGVGPIAFPRYSGGTATQTWFIPLVSATYSDIAYIEPLRAGVYLWGNDDHTKGLGVAIEPRLGYSPVDGPRLGGLAKRKNSVEGGPTFDWDLGVFQLSVSLMTDLTGSSRGNSARLYAYRELITGPALKLGMFAGLDRLGAKTANYFFGVAPSEAIVGRPSFQTGSAINSTAGVDGRYRLSERYSVLFGAQTYRLGGGLSHSPLIETRQSALGWLGLGWNL